MSTTFSKIGYGFKEKTKEGKDYLKLKLDPRAFVSMPTLAIYQSVVVLKNDYKQGSYVVCAATDIGYKLDNNKLFSIKEEK